MISNLFLLVDKDHQVVYFCMLSPSYLLHAFIKVVEGDPKFFKIIDPLLNMVPSTLHLS
jgi:hypothetical protein